MVGDSGTVFQRRNHRTARERRGRPVRSQTRDCDRMSQSSPAVKRRPPAPAAQRAGWLAYRRRHARPACVHPGERGRGTGCPYGTPRPPSHRWLASQRPRPGAGRNDDRKVRRARLSFLAKPAICCRSIEVCSPSSWTTTTGSANRSRAHTCFALAEQASEEAVRRTWCSSEAGVSGTRAEMLARRALTRERE